MCVSMSFALISYSRSNKSSKLGFFRHDLNSTRLQLDKAIKFGSNGGELNVSGTTFMSSVKASRNASVNGNGGYSEYDELRFKVVDTSDGEIQFDELVKEKSGVDTVSEDLSGSSRFFYGKRSGEGVKGGLNLKDEETVKTDDLGGVDSKMEELDEVNVNVGLRRRRQMMTRSSMFAKQVITIQSALSLGFVSQLWVDTTYWVVMIVEVKPNLLSGESEKFLLEDVAQVGDVVLVQDESVVESTVRMVGLETLVGYNVATPTRQNIGKVKGYTFNINSGVVESLELDSFGIAIIPSALVSTYALFVEDVIEVLSDTVVVHEAASSRVQRLSKGLWGSRNMGTSIQEFEEYSDKERQPYDNERDPKVQRSSKRKKPRRKVRDVEDEWDLPMDYL